MRIHLGKKFQYIIICLIVFLILLTIGIVIFYTNKMLNITSAENDYSDSSQKYHIIITGSFSNINFLQKVYEGALSQCDKKHAVVELIVPSSKAEDRTLQDQFTYASFVDADGIIAWIDDADSINTSPITPTGEEIPIVTLGNYVDSISQVSYIGVGNFELGRTLATEIQNVLGDKGNILVIIDSEKNELSYSLLMNGMQNTLQTTPEIQLSFFEVQETNELTSEDFIKQGIISNKDIDLIVCLTPKDTSRVIQSVIDLNISGSVGIVGFSDEQEATDYIEKGIATVLLSQNPQKIGQMAMEQLFEYKESGYANKIIITDISVLKAETDNKGDKK